MLSTNPLRIASSSRALLHPSWLTTNRMTVPMAVTYSANSLSTGLPGKEARRRHRNTGAPGEERGMTYYTNRANSPRTYCTGRAMLNCWNCKKPLDRTTSFFCMSCKVVQPPEEGSSYFKIMDW